MIELTSGQRLWLNTYVAEGLRSLGIAITPLSVEAETRRALRTPCDYAPPDPYSAALTNRRAEEAAGASYRPSTRRTNHVLDAAGVPDGYATALRTLREVGADDSHK